MKRSLWFVLLLLPGLAAAQVAEKITVSLVEVPVAVVDGSGNPVRGLKAENFELSDDRGRHEITSFDAIDFAAPGAEIMAPARRNFLFLFDLSNATPKSMQRAQTAAGEFVKRQSHPRDLFAVGTIDADHGFRMVTAFTSDRPLVVAALENPKAFMTRDPLGLANQGRVASADAAVSPVVSVEATCFT